MFAIAGLTGNTGAAAAEALLAEGLPVRGLVREPARAAAWAARGVELATADLADVPALTRALTGVEAAYVMLPPATQAPDPVGLYAAQATAVRAAARAAGLRRLVFLSSVGAQHAQGNGPIRGLHVAEALLADAAPEVVFLRPSFFQENWQPAFAMAQAQGVFPSFAPAGTAAFDMIATRDIGAEAARLLRESAPPRVVELGSVAQHGPEEAAAIAGHVLGREVTLVSPPRPAWEGILAEAGLGPAFAALIAEMYEGIGSGHVGFAAPAAVRRGPTTLEQTMKGWL